jgi:hypothetical protein
MFVDVDIFCAPTSVPIIKSIITKKGMIRSLIGNNILDGFQKYLSLCSVSDD